MKKIAFLTSGGDAPGMNAAIRAIVKTCLHYKITPFGIFDGYQGMIEGRGKEMTYADVDNIIQYGGTILSQENNIPIIGLPGTIDNDIYGTEYTIGFDTALNTVIDAVDKIRDTASSHHRIFFVEVMGRDADR